MIHWMRDRLAKDESGFTLIELMVVVLIIAILIAIAIPTFLGARERAQDRAAQSNLRNGLSAAKVYYVDTEEYTGATAGTDDLNEIEPSLTWVENSVAAAGDAGEVHATAFEAGDLQGVCLTAVSPSGTFFAIVDLATGTGAGTYYNSGAAAVTCPADDDAAPGGTWVTTGW
jgi:type IV pilus assembly protein PilA